MTGSAMLVPADTLSLIDFGAAKEYPKRFVDDYLRMVRACADRNRDEVILRSTRMGFLTGDAGAGLMAVGAAACWQGHPCAALLEAAWPARGLRACHAAEVLVSCIDCLP